MWSLSNQKPETRNRKCRKLYQLLVSGFWLLTSGCGFHAVYGPQANTTGNTDSAMLASVRIEPIEGRIGQEFKQDLEDQLNPGDFINAPAVYRLHVTLAVTEGAIGVSRDGTVSRYNVNMSSSYTLTRAADNVVVSSGLLNHISSYNNVINAYFSTYISDEDASKRGVAELAEIYRARLSSYFDQGAPVQKNAAVPAGAMPVPPTSPFTPLMPNAPGVTSPSGYR